MSLERFNSPEWWAAFFRYEPNIQLEFVHEYLEIKLGIARGWNDDLAGQFLCDWRENGHVYIHTELLTLQQVAGLLAGYQITIIENCPLIVETADIFDHTFKTPLSLPAHTPENFTQMLVEAELLLRDAHPWVWGWRKWCISNRDETTIEHESRRSTPGEN